MTIQLGDGEFEKKIALLNKRSKTHCKTKEKRGGRRDTVYSWSTDEFVSEI